VAASQHQGSLTGVGRFAASRPPYAFTTIYSSYLIEKDIPNFDGRTVNAVRRAKRKVKVEMIECSKRYWRLLWCSLPRANPDRPSYADEERGFTAATATKPVKTGTTLPGSCAVGEMFFKTDAPAGPTCTAARRQIPGPRRAAFQPGLLVRFHGQHAQVQDASGNIFAAVKTSPVRRRTNGWIISRRGRPPYLAADSGRRGALADSGANGVPYRSGPGTRCWPTPTI